MFLPSSSYSFASIGYSDVIQHSGVAQPLSGRLPQTVRRVESAASDAEIVVPGMCAPHSLEAILAFLQVRPEAAEHTARALAAGTPERLLRQGAGVLVFAVGGYDVAVDAAIRDMIADKVVEHILLCPKAHGLSHWSLAIKSVTA